MNFCSLELFQNVFYFSFFKLVIFRYLYIYVVHTNCLTSIINSAYFLYFMFVLHICAGYTSPDFTTLQIVNCLVKISILISHQGCHTLRELRETQGIFSLKKFSGRLRKSQGILIYFLNSGKLREVLIFSKNSGKF